MRRLGKHTTYEFQTHVELDAPSVMCSWRNISASKISRYTVLFYVTECCRLFTMPRIYGVLYMMYVCDALLINKRCTYVTHS